MSYLVNFVILAGVNILFVLALEREVWNSQNLWNEDWDLVGFVNGKVFIANNQEYAQHGTAQTRCQENNATLARIETADEENLIKAYMNMTNPTVDHYWLDATDYPNEGIWHWASNNQLLSYGTFYTGNTKSTNCAAISRSIEAWVPGSCSEPGGDSNNNVHSLCQVSEFRV